MRDYLHCFHFRRRPLLLLRMSLVWLCLVSGIVSSRADDIDDVLHPFWTSNTIHRETLLFVKEKGETFAKAHLTFPIQKLLSVRQAGWRQGKQKTYLANKDFTYSAGSHTLTLTHRSAIPFRTRDSFYSPTEGLPYKTKITDPLNSYTPYGPSGKGPHVRTSDNADPLQQVEVSYTFTAHWNGYIPRFQEVALRGSLLKLAHRQPLRLLVVGDSISFGFGASGMGGQEQQGFRPRRPGYASLLVAALRRAYKTDAIRLDNRSQPSIDSGQGAYDIGGQMSPDTDLVIVAYGMNDAANGVHGRRRDRVADFKANIRNILNAIRIKNPDAGIILVSPMLGNPEWTRTLTPFFLHTSQYPNFSSAQQALHELASQTPGVAVADMTQLWHDILAAKGWQYQNLLDGKPLTGWYDLAANGVNHPNDYGHLLYAQVLAALLIPPKH